MNDRHPSGDSCSPAPAPDAAYEPYSSYDSGSVQYGDGSGGYPGTGYDSGYDGYDAYASGQVASTATTFVPEQPGPVDPYATGYPADTFTTGSYAPGAFAGATDFGTDPLFGDLPGAASSSTGGYPTDPYATDPYGTAAGYAGQDPYDGYGTVGTAYGSGGSYDTGVTEPAGWAGQGYDQDQQWATDPYGTQAVDPAAYATTGYEAAYGQAPQVPAQRQGLDPHGFEAHGLNTQYLEADYLASATTAPAAATDAFAQPQFGRIEPELADYERELTGYDATGATYASGAEYAEGEYGEYSGAEDGGAGNGGNTATADSTDNGAYAEYDEYADGTQYAEDQQYAEDGSYPADGSYADDTRTEYAADDAPYDEDASYDNTPYEDDDACADSPEQAPDVAPVSGRGEGPVRPRGGRSGRVPAGRTRRRAPARRSALLTVAVPSVCVIGVAGAAAASVVGGGDSNTSASAVKPAVANNRLDAQLDGLSADTRDFADRASRTQERIDLKAQQEAKEEAARKKAKEEAARKERLRPKFLLPVTQHGLSAYFGQAGVNWMSVHTGIDFPVAYGTQVMSATDGTVRMQYNTAYGNMAIVTAKDGTETWYCHLSSYRVSSGTTVKAGDVIAFSGNSGNSTGPHLHFEVRPGGGSPIDPLPWLRSHGLNPQ